MKLKLMFAALALCAIFALSVGPPGGNQVTTKIDYSSTNLGAGDSIAFTVPLGLASPQMICGVALPGITLGAKAESPPGQFASDFSYNLKSNDLGLSPSAEYGVCYKSPSPPGSFAGLSATTPNASRSLVPG